VPPPTPPTERVLSRRRAIGRQIRDARLAAKRTQEEVALRTEMDRATYVRIEQGQSSPLLDTLIRIADTLSVPLAHLVRDD
jgi:transcriptional regulator with XRE-family HTH domain